MYPNHNLCLILFSFLVLTTIQAQVSVISLGGNSSSSSGSVSYSVGELVFKTNSDSSGSVLIGTQQPYEISIVLSLEEIYGIDIDFCVYPNPMTDFIKLKVDSYYNYNELSYRIFDVSGRVLVNSRILGKETNIQVSNFVPATYFMKLFVNNEGVKTFKIIKN